MGRSIGTWLLVALLLVAHFVLHVGFGYGRGAPDLLTIGLLLAARETGVGTAALVGLVFGLLEDALSVLAFGANSVTMTVIGIAGAFTRDLFVGDSRLFVISYFFVGKWMRDLLHWLMVGEGLRQPFASEVLWQGTLGAAYAALIGMVLLTVTGRAGEAR
ncbi:MAG: rod shape-determining protein MreD [Longimicrobiales bacterium]